MKWLTVLLSLYLIGLSVWPCSDERLPVVSQTSAAMVVSVATQPPASAHHHHEQCTPLCSCACCATTLTHLPRFGYLLAPPTEEVAISTECFTYVPIPWAAPYTAIWQPPQIRA